MSGCLWQVTFRLSGNTVLWVLSSMRIVSAGSLCVLDTRCSCEEHPAAAAFPSLTRRVGQGQLDQRFNQAESAHMHMSTSCAETPTPT
jgi:hypothetical protein